MEEMKNIDKMLVGKPEGRTKEGNIRMCLKETG
jgi:hypothetical protein